MGLLFKYSNATVLSAFSMPTVAESPRSMAAELISLYWKVYRAVLVQQRFKRHPFSVVPPRNATLRHSTTNCRLGAVPVYSGVHPGAAVDDQIVPERVDRRVRLRRYPARSTFQVAVCGLAKVRKPLVDDIRGGVVAAVEAERERQVHLRRILVARQCEPRRARHEVERRRLAAVAVASSSCCGRLDIERRCRPIHRDVLALQTRSSGQSGAQYI